MDIPLPQSSNGDPTPFYAQDGSIILVGDRLKNAWATNLLVTKHPVTNMFIAEKDLGGGKKVQYKVKGGEEKV